MARKSPPQRRGWGQIAKLPSGNYRASYVGPDGARHAAPNTFTMRMDAEHWLSDERRLIDQDAWTPPAVRAASAAAAKTTLADYAQRWINQRRLKDRTREHYRDICARFIAPTPIGSVPLRYLTAEAVRIWYASLPTHTPTMRAHCYVLAHAVLATAVTDGLIAANPCRIPGASSAPRRREPVILTTDAVSAIAGGIDGRFRVLVLIAAWWGLRFGEVTELRRKDIAPDASVITVARGVTHRGRICTVSSPKSGRVRHVVVPPHIRGDVLEALAGVGRSPDALLFPAARGGCHLDHQIVRYHFHAACRDALGHDNVRLHDLRHFAGTMTALTGATLAETMARLGHSTPKAAMFYQGVVSGRDVAIAEALSALASAG